jgi:GH15 family glucan-1,4-alpha-glucosidase
MQADLTGPAPLTPAAGLRPHGPPSAGGYLPIAGHGVIGDLGTAALVGSEGTIDWYCPLRFDAPSIFGAILDARRGGHWSICPAGRAWGSTQHYLPDTNVLITRFLCEEGVAEIQDFMPVGGAHSVMRRVVGVRGSPHLVVEVEPRFDYGRCRHTVHITDGGAVFESSALRMALTSPVPLRRTLDGVQAKLCLEPGRVLDFVVSPFDPGAGLRVSASLETTIEFWRTWAAGCSYSGRWGDAARRSALTAKLLTHASSGATVGAATTSLPKRLGGSDNRDERLASIGGLAPFLLAMRRLGFAEEARASVSWLGERLSQPLQKAYALDGHAGLAEIELGLLEGYRGSPPVRVGAEARHGPSPLVLRELLDALERSDAPADVRASVARRAGPRSGDWDGSLPLDAELLRLPALGLADAGDPRWLATLDSIEAALVSDVLVDRRPPSGDEGTCTACSFWRVEALAHAGRLAEARLAFEKMLGYANHLGLYAEAIGPGGEQLGNFPHASPHLALLSAALTLEERLG